MLSGKLYAVLQAFQSAILDNVYMKESLDTACVGIRFLVCSFQIRAGPVLLSLLRSYQAVLLRFCRAARVQLVLKFYTKGVLNRANSTNYYNYLLTTRTWTGVR